MYFLPSNLSLLACVFNNSCCTKSVILINHWKEQWKRTRVGCLMQHIMGTSAIVVVVLLSSSSPSSSSARHKLWIVEPIKSVPPLLLLLLCCVYYKCLYCIVLIDWTMVISVSSKRVQIHKPDVDPAHTPKTGFWCLILCSDLLFLLYIK